MRALRRHHRHAGRATTRRPAARLPFLVPRRPSGMPDVPPAEQAPMPPTEEIRAGVDMDFAARRVRAAGGPSDTARYMCACGYAFDAPVSATVRCPHCGGEQAW